MIEIPVVIDKADITVCAGHKGALNADTFAAGDGPHPYAPDSLIYLGFAGARGIDGRYHGVHRFEPAHEQGAMDCDRRIAFAALPGWGTPVESEEYDGI